MCWEFHYRHKIMTWYCWNFCHNKPHELSCQIQSSTIQTQPYYSEGSCSYLEGVQESPDLRSGALPTTYYYCLRSEDVQWLQNGDLHRACQGTVPLWNILILLEYTELSWLVELYFLMLVSIRLLVNVWKFGRTFGQAFLSPPSDTGEEHLQMSGCPTYFADTVLLVILKNIPPYSIISHFSVIWNSVASRQGLASHRWLYNLSREWTTFNWASHNHNIAVLLRYVSAIRNWQIFWCGSRPASAYRSGSRHLGKFAWGSNLALVFDAVQSRPSTTFPESWHDYRKQYFRSFGRGICLPDSPNWTYIDRITT